MSRRTGFHRGIARVRVVADMQKTADLEPAPDDVHNGLARILGRSDARYAELTFT